MFPFRAKLTDQDKNLYLISFGILITCLLDNVWILKREGTCKSLLRLKGLRLYILFLPDSFFFTLAVKMRYGFSYLQQVCFSEKAQNQHFWATTTSRSSRQCCPCIEKCPLEGSSPQFLEMLSLISAVPIFLDEN